MASEGQALSSQAAAWLAKLQHEAVSAADRSEFERWLEADPAHAVAFARVEFAWERAERLRALPALTREGSRGSWFGLLRWNRFSWDLSLWPLAAAMALVAVILPVWYFTIHDTVYVTGLGERRTVALADGSQTSLNTSSRVKIDFDEETRTVLLMQGEALFKVTHDAQRPFVVKAGNTVVRAVGTAFNVRMLDQAVEVTVTEGVVSVDGKTRIEAGSAVVVAAGAVKRISLTEDSLRRRVAWREGVIELKGETLDQAVEEFNRYRKSKLVVADPAIASIRVGGRFETDEATKFVNALKVNFAIRAVEHADGSIYLLGSESGAP